jgi:hypothetical protein
MSLTNWRSMKMAKIWPPEAPTMIRAVRVLSRFRSRSRLNSGTRFAMAGIIMSSRMAFHRKVDRGMRRRAKK